MSRKKDRTNSNPIDIYLINLNDYDIVRNINHGGFGIINLVKNKKTNEKYAAKTNLIQNKTQNKFFISREVRILAQIQHLTIIQFRGFSYVDFHGEKKYNNIDGLHERRILSTFNRQRVQKPMSI